MRTLRIVRAIVLCALGVGLATSTALAAGPIKSPAPTPPDYPFMCGDLLINAHAVVNGNIKIFTARDGTTRVMFNGRFETILTRVKRPHDIQYQLERTGNDHHSRRGRLPEHYRCTRANVVLHSDWCLAVNRTGND